MQNRCRPSLGVAVLPALGACLALLGCTDAAPVRVDRVILISIDTLRADHLGAYGHARNTSPRLDALAARGALFEDASTTAPWTLPSMASIMTMSTRSHCSSVISPWIKTVIPFATG